MGTCAHCSKVLKNHPAAIKNHLLHCRSYKPPKYLGPRIKPVTAHARKRNAVSVAVDAPGNLPELEMPEVRV